MINPWIILAIFLAFFGFYGYGHHRGWDDRDIEIGRAHV